jgi:hypothetical protein
VESIFVRGPYQPISINLSESNRLKHYRLALLFEQKGPKINKLHRTIDTLQREDTDLETAPQELHEKRELGNNRLNNTAKTQIEASAVTKSSKPNVKNW